MNVKVAHKHPRMITYVRVAVILCLVTFAEFVLFYVEAVKPFFVPLLLVLSGSKFLLVVMFYMHLKFDHPIFYRLLSIAVLIGLGLLLALMSLFLIAHPVVRPAVA